MVVKLLFGGGGGGRKRETAAASDNNRLLNRGTNHGGSSGSSSNSTGKPFHGDANKPSRRIQQDFGPRKVPKQVPKHLGVAATPRITVVSTQGGGPIPTPPTTDATYRGDSDEYDNDDEEIGGGYGNDVSATSSTMLLQLQVRHQRHENLNDSFEVLTAESQLALEKEQTIRKQLFGGGAPPRDEHPHQTTAAAPVDAEEEATPDLSKSAVDTSSSTASSSSRMYTPKQNVQFVRFSSSSAPDAARLLEAATKNNDDGHPRGRKAGSGATGRGASQLPQPSASNAAALAAHGHVPPANAPLRTGANEPTAHMPMQTRGTGLRADATPPRAVIAPGSIPLTLPTGGGATRKPPRPPTAPSSANVMCTISPPAKPFRSHMGSFDTLDTSMSPITILRHDPNLSLDTTQTTGNLGLATDGGGGGGGKPGEDTRAAPPPTTSSFATPNTSQWMDQWHEFKSKVSLAVASCQPRASLMAQKSESLVMDLFYDASSPIFHCLGKDARADPKRPLYNEEVTLEFIHLMMTTGVTVLHMQPPHTPPLNPTLDWKGRSVVMILEPGGGGGGGGTPGHEGCVPRLEWTTVAGGTHFEIATAGLHLLEILSVRSRDDEHDEAFVDDDELDDEFGDDETNPSTDDDRPFTSRRGGKYLSRRHALSADQGSLASTTVTDEPPGLDFSCFFTITSTSGDVHVFEAASVQDKDKIIQGLRNVIAWLSYSTVMGDTTASSILFSEVTHHNGPDDEPAELPMLAKHPHRIAMNRTAHVLLDE